MAEQTLTTKEAFLLCVFLILGTLVVMMIFQYVKLNSKSTIFCGVITRQYVREESETSRNGTFDVYYFTVSNNNQNKTFSYLDNNLVRKLINPYEKNNLKILNQAKINDKLCVKYSLQYNENMSGSGVQKNMPYLISVSTME